MKLIDEILAIGIYGPFVIGFIIVMTVLILASRMKKWL